MFIQPSRRDFLQTSAIIAGSLVFPKAVVANEPDKFFFIQTDTNDSWSITDPVQWSLENVHKPILERAKQGLMNLTSGNGDRIIRLVVRRCRLNLIELQQQQVVIHHWGPHRADVRPLFKSHRLARPEIEVVVRNRKTETTDSKSGDDFLFGERLASDFPCELFQTKWMNRFENEPDDWTPAMRTYSGYAWESVENNGIPWSALKSAWRKSSPMVCQNCDEPTILTNFGNPSVSLFSHLTRFIYVCGSCQRTFSDEAVRDIDGWMTKNLDEAVLPDFKMVWSKRLKMEWKV